MFVHTFANQIKTMGADNKATLEEIEAFLNEFKTKSKIFGIDYDRHKEENFQTLLDLEMPPDERTMTYTISNPLIIIKDQEKTNTTTKKEMYGCSVSV